MKSRIFLVLGLSASLHAASPITAIDLRTLRSRAAQSQPEAQYELGRRFDHGIGVPQSDRQALKFYRQAAAQNLPQAQYQIGRKYSAGEGVERDHAVAVHWFRHAARQNYALAQNRLGRCFELGQGVQQDWVEAYQWYALAARNSRCVFAVVNRDALRLRAEQIAEAELRIAALFTVLP